MTTHTHRWYSHRSEGSTERTVGVVQGEEVELVRTWPATYGLRCYVCKRSKADPSRPDPRLPWLRADTGEPVRGAKFP